MNIEQTVENLAKARHGVTLGTHNISKQRARVERLERKGYDSSRAKRMLATLQSTQLVFVEHQDRLEEKLKSLGQSRIIESQVPRSFDLRGEGEMAERIQTYNWSATPLGAISMWPSSLRALVELMLAHPLPFAIACGPERLFLYNDAIDRLLRDRGSALGRAALSAFPHDCRLAEDALRRAFAGESAVAEVRFGADPEQKRFRVHFTPEADIHASLTWVRLVSGTPRAAMKKAPSLNMSVAGSAGTDDRMWTPEPPVRAANLIALMRSITRRTAETSPTVEDYAIHLEGRLDALARVQTTLARDPMNSAALDVLIAGELMAVGGRAIERVAVSGIPLRFLADPAYLIALAIHELTSNAVKFGGLSPTGGQLRISWELQCRPTPRWLFGWKESKVEGLDCLPKHRGFGLDLIERVLTYELNATTTWTVESDGVLCTIEIPDPDRVSI